MAEPQTLASSTLSSEFTFGGPDPVLRPVPEVSGTDWATLGGLIAAVGFIVIALVISGSYTAFADISSVLIVVLGTAAVTLVCFRWDDLRMVTPILKKSFSYHGHDLQVLARTLVDMSILVRRRGTLALADYERLWRSDPLLYPYVAMIVDGFAPQDIERTAAQEMDTSLELYRKASAVLRRAAESAPGMGLIGTLIGLVEMLGNLQSPESLGPSMAIALLTTFYGAFLGTVILTPLANKIERNANNEVVERQMILAAATAMSVLDNPRRLEMTLNAFLPRDKRLAYLTKEFG